MWAPQSKLQITGFNHFVLKSIINSQTQVEIRVPTGPTQKENDVMTENRSKGVCRIRTREQNQ